MDGFVPDALDHPFLRAAILFSRRYGRFLLRSETDTFAALAISLDARPMANGGRVHAGRHRVDIQISVGIFRSDLGSRRFDGDAGGAGAHAGEMAGIVFA